MIPQGSASLHPGLTRVGPAALLEAVGVRSSFHPLGPRYRAMRRYTCRLCSVPQGSASPHPGLTRVGPAALLEEVGVRSSFYPLGPRYRAMRRYTCRLCSVPQGSASLHPGLTRVGLAALLEEVGVRSSFHPLGPRYRAMRLYTCRLCSVPQGSLRSPWVDTCRACSPLGSGSIWCLIVEQVVNVVWDVVLLEQLQIFVLVVYLCVMLFLSLYVAFCGRTYGLTY